MNGLRRLGKNIENAIIDNNLTIEEVGEKINASINDMERLIQGRLILNFQQLKEISKMTNTTVKELLDTNKEYHFTDGNFTNQENEDKILDIIDNYIDLVEATS